MEEKKRRSPRKLDIQFKLGVLKDYYESGRSLESISRKYSFQSGMGRKTRCQWLPLGEAGE